MRDSYYQYCRSTYPFDDKPIREQFETFKNDCLIKYKDYYKDNPKEIEFLIKSVRQLCDLRIKMLAIQKARGKYKNRFKKMKPYYSDFKFTAFHLYNKLIELDFRQAVKNGSMFSGFANIKDIPLGIRDIQY